MQNQIDGAGYVIEDRTGSATGDRVGPGDCTGIALDRSCGWDNVLESMELRQRLRFALEQMQGLS